VNHSAEKNTLKRKRDLRVETLWTQGELKDYTQILKNLFPAGAKKRQKNWETSGESSIRKQVKKVDKVEK